MNFLALVVGLGLERLLTWVFHLRAFHWLDPLFDAIWRRLPSHSSVRTVLLLTGGLVVLVLPVALIEWTLHIRLAYLPEFLFAVVVLILCLGPRDLAAEVADYRDGLAAADPARVHAAAGELLEREPDGDVDALEVERAIYVQACNRIFGVVFWFFCLGAAGAWLFRVLDLLRQHALRRHTDDAAALPEIALPLVLALHAVLAWIPRRLLMIGFTLAGSYDHAVAAWRQAPAESISLAADDSALLGRVGVAAASPQDEADDCQRAGKAMRLINRTLWVIWCPILALMTLSDWIL